ncbi:DUF4139 domain-containing protein [Ruegeria sp.]|uniref:DUF4139 domain-containing protein n=1 Tax=Ruegeria sp. TaxID=1879320 RepID=UPI00230D4D07|nr:DUF4139 domain-containing protein [Ruegeria sp.]MDA7963689.1 DUF4139 domain-containing protein [Ruegeria sp.]
MRHLLFPLLLTPTLLSAETFTLDTKVSEVTVYPSGAEITRAAQFDIPAGHHRLVLLGMPLSEIDAQLATLQVRAEGLTQTAQIIRGENVPWHEYQSDAVKQAEDRIEGIEKQIQAVEDDAQTARLKAEAARHTISFLANLGRNEGLAGSDADSLRGIAQMVGTESLAAEEAAQKAEIEGRRIEEQLKDLQTALEAAEADLQALVPETDDRLFVALDVIAETDIQGTLSLSYLDFRLAEWSPAYTFDLITGDTPEVRIERRILVNQNTGENWQDITLSVSTLQPTGKNSATTVRSRRQTISPAISRANLGSLEEPVVEAPVVVEETQGWTPSPASVAGTGITYTLSEPVSISSGYELAEFELDNMTQTAQVFAMAAPIYDDTAYRTARFTNPYDQNLMSSAVARWLVDGVLVATDSVPEIGPREEVELGFGPLYGLTIDRHILSRSSGDVGLISRSNQNVERVQIVARNLTGQSWPLRILDRVPYSEQDDLTITWSAQPKPSDENVDNKRGVLAWEMELAPDQSETIQLDTTLAWPEGMELD